jgi:2-phospho-L-lactate guanylyltransferase
MTSHRSADDIWAVVPAKGFAQAKNRLSPHLDAGQRALLARAMLRDVLGVVARTESFAGSLLVSGDADVARMGAEYGVATLLDPAEGGTNAAVQCGLDHLRSIGAARCVVIQGDLPFLSDVELSKVLAALARHDMVLVPARRDGGTNILALRRSDLIAPQFGEDSFARHCRAASDLGIEPEVLKLRGGGHDIDIPEDLDFVAGAGTGVHTQALLRSLALQRRSPKEIPSR